MDPTGGTSLCKPHSQKRSLNIPVFLAPPSIKDAHRRCCPRTVTRAKRQGKTSRCDEKPSKTTPSKFVKSLTCVVHRTYGPFPSSRGNKNMEFTHRLTTAIFTHKKWESGSIKSWFEKESRIIGSGLERTYKVENRAVLTDHKQDDAHGLPHSLQNKHHSNRVYSLQACVWKGSMPIFTIEGSMTQSQQGLKASKLHPID
ncbi:hypothetical protein Tco_0355243 [Tanacetum coccineum]